MLRIEGVQGNYSGFDIDILDLQAEPESFDPRAHIFTEWNSLAVSRLKAHGSIIRKNKGGNTDQKSSTIVHLDRVKLDGIDVDLYLNDSTRLVAREGNLNISALSLGAGLPSFDTFEFEMDGLDYTTPSLAVRSGPLRLNNTNTSSIENLILNTAARDSLHVDKSQIDRTTAGDSIWKMDKIHLHKTAFSQSGSNFQSLADSLVLNSINITKGRMPYVEHILAYGTNVSIQNGENVSVSDKSSKKKGKESKPMALASLCGKATIFPGSYAIGKTILTYEEINIDTSPNAKHISINELSMETPAAQFHVGSIETIGADLELSRIRIDPDNSYSPEFETDIVSGSINSLTFQNVDYDQLLGENQFISDKLQIDGFSLSIRRDKTLPDPPEKIKPHLLSQLIPVSESFQLPGISVSNGTLTYREVGEKTGQEGRIRLDSIKFDLALNNSIDEPERVLSGSASLYNEGKLYFNYSRLDSHRFDLEIRLLDFPLDSINQMIDPLEAVKIKSGIIKEYDLSVQADSVLATGQALITYDDLHIEIFKRHEPDVRNFGNDLLTLLADGIILKHSKTDAIANFNQERIIHKGPINYWVKCAINGAMRAIRKGRDERNVAD